LKILSAEFVTSAAAGGRADGIPRDGRPQIALAGRSNVGKSTLINALCKKKIARTSAAPGKTRLANVYRVSLEGGGGPGRWELYLVDLPGYGYARGGAESAQELAAVALSAQSPDPVGVFFGAWLGVTLVSIGSVVLGRLLKTNLSHRVVRASSAAVFVLIGGTSPEEFLQKTGVEIVEKELSAQAW